HPHRTYGGGDPRTRGARNLSSPWHAADANTPRWPRRSPAANQHNRADAARVVATRGYRAHTKSDPRRDREAYLRARTRRRRLAAKPADPHPPQAAGRHRAPFDESGIAADVAGAALPDPDGVPRTGLGRPY